MNKELLLNIIKLRFLIGFLGEKKQYNWWTSDFLSSSSVSFLTPVFARTSIMAQYQGVKEAARIEHDSKIGIGANVFHLFRLPESIEIKLYNLLQDKQVSSELSKLLQDKQTAEKALEKLADKTISSSVGPIKKGDISDIPEENHWKKLAMQYILAFHSDKKIFPYFQEAK
jgi:hypothetical protein